MAVYKDEDITAALLRQEFPHVVADLQEEETITADTLRESHPSVAASLIEEGRAAASASIGEAVAAENQRVIAITALARPGAEHIITAALADSTMTVDKVKVSLYDLDEETRRGAHASHKEDGEKLAASLAGMKADGDNPDTQKDTKKVSHEKVMKKIEGAK